MAVSSESESVVSGGGDPVKSCITARTTALDDPAVAARIAVCATCEHGIPRMGRLFCRAADEFVQRVATVGSCPKALWPPTLRDLRERTCLKCRWYEENDPKLGYAPTCELLKKEDGLGSGGSGPGSRALGFRTPSPEPRAPSPRPCAILLAELLRTGAPHPDRKCPWRGLPKTGA